VSEVLIAALVGIAAGLVAGRWLSSGLESLVYGVEAGNWITAVVSAVVMLIVSALAAVVPAQRAVRMQPTRALRIE
jgi:ABC-type antimicrobial peptide transport system permease subunit